MKKTVVLILCIVFILSIGSPTVLYANSDTNYSYDSNNFLEEVVNENGQSTFFIRDKNGNQIKKSSALTFNGTNQLNLSNIAVNTEAGAKNTVEFWMYWDGTNGVMPFSWNSGPFYNLYFYNGYFGFNTGQSDLLGMSSVNLKNRWVHVAAAFYNGVPDSIQNEIYINGEKQTLVQGIGQTTTARRAVESAVISGVAGGQYKFKGKIGEVRIWNYALTQAQVQENMYKVIKEEPGLVGYWKLGNPVGANSSLNFDGTNQLNLSNIAVNTEVGAKNTVEFWMYWDGTNGVMPFSWNSGPLYNLYFYNGYFGFNTGQSDLLGMSSVNLKNRWVHVAAAFYNGVPDSIQNEIYINGEKQTLVQGIGQTTASRSAVTSAVISGVREGHYKFKGKIGEVRIWNYALTQAQVQENMYKVIKEEPGLVGYWKLGSPVGVNSSLNFDGTNQLNLSNIAVNTASGAKNTVEFWMYWDGTNGVMPFSWNNGPLYNLYFYNGYFGFNTGQSDLIGMLSENLKNRWVHVATVFYNGVPDSVQNELYINGKKQTLVPAIGQTITARSVGTSAVISGLTGGQYKFKGKIGEVRIWNYALTQAQVQENMYKVIREEPGLVGYWKLGE